MVGLAASASPSLLVVLELLGVDVIGLALGPLGSDQGGPGRATSSPALLFQTGQTVPRRDSPTTASCSAAYPGEVVLAPIVTAYAVGVAMNGFLPANIGTFVTLLMFVAIIPSATFAGSFAAYLVQKIFFTIVGTFVYLYLFLSVQARLTRASATSPNIRQ